MERSLDSQSYERKAGALTGFIKRIMDILLSLIGIVLASPIMLIVAICIKSEDKGPALFIQTRTGKNDQPFSIYKFRSMKTAPNQVRPARQYEWEGGVPDDFVFKQTDEVDPNVTKVGAFIRKTSLDELPQLFNVLLGNMSMIGPRPEIPAITTHYNAQQKQRLLVKPGITGWAQVNGRSDVTNGEKMAMDYYYIKNQSMALDLTILWKTVQVVLTSKGAV
ncbi:sugar transferase [Listeria booriae]|uniref:Sugar transferase n=1 Tax=Listeria booriae TaxID=1552123 RepID=A0A7X0Z141_9LIST|nr:sugar transferase [Listeria booriae]MBC2167313.1 sugar transferase [Listeria booriae]MBC2180013.1 sugar transferase [Listeria booriae]MBC2187840.1 sugar transferase [Listeria booriae]